MSAPTLLPLAARELAWRRLWAVLLSPPPKPPAPPDKAVAAGCEPAARKGAA